MSSDSKWWLLTRIVLLCVLLEAVGMGGAWILSQFPLPTDFVPPHLCCWKGE